MSNTRLVTSFSLLGLAFAVTLAGEIALAAQQIQFGAPLIALGIVLVTAALIFTPPDIAELTRWQISLPPTFQRESDSVDWLHALGWGLLLACMLITFLASSGNQFTVVGVAAWGASILLAFLLLGQRRDVTESQTTLKAKRWPTRNLLRWGLVLGILVVAIFSYYYRLEDVPAEMTSDHAEKLLDVNDVLHGARPIFFTRNTGREPLQFYLTAGLISATHIPLNHMALKLITAGVGVLTVLAVYFLGIEIFVPEAALIAAFLTAVAHWAMATARIGLRYPFETLCVALVLLFLFRALKCGRRNDFLLTGFFIGVGLLGYSPFRFAPLLVGLILLLFALTAGRGNLNPGLYFENCVYLAVIAFIVFMPLFHYMLERPDLFWFRALTRLTPLEQPVSSDLPGTLFQNLKGTVLMFNWRGDEDWPTNVPFTPALDPITGSLFILGVAMALWNWLARRENIYAYLLLVVFVMLLPSALDVAFPNEVPSFVRSVGAIPALALISAAPLAFLFRLLRQMGGWVQGLAVAFVAVTLLCVAILNWNFYFSDYARTYLADSWNTREIAAVMNGLAKEGFSTENTYVVSSPDWVDWRNIAINLGDMNWKNLMMDASEAKPLVGKKEPQLFILNPRNLAGIAYLQNLFPRGTRELYASKTPGKDFVLFLVP